jgi:hypothetical protein
MFERQYSDEDLCDIPHWQYAKEIIRCYAEIERQRALIERAMPLFKEAGSSLRYPRGAHAIEYWENQYSNWLKDAND